METSALARQLAGRFVAGETLADALAVAKKVNAEGIEITLDHLGEHIANLGEADAATRDYLDMVAAITHAGIGRNIDCSETTTARLADRLEAIVADHGGSVPVVGHSRGGMLAKVLARRRPDLVSGIVTLGSPMLAPGAHHRSLTASVDMLVRLSRAGVPRLMSADCVGGALGALVIVGSMSAARVRRPQSPSGEVAQAD